MDFQKVTRARFKSKSSIIAEQILEMIKTGEYKIGGKLPPERVIAEKMGVSRPSVREAISALSIVGILETRPGDGTYVSTPQVTENNILEALAVLEEGDSPFENLQARKMVEIGVVQLAIQVATDEDILKIKTAWEKKYERGLQGDYESYIKYGKEFHLAIARATKNRVIEAMMDRLLNMTIEPLWVGMRREYFEGDHSRIKEMLEIHDHVVRAIQERDSEKAVRMLEKHFDIQVEQIYHPHEESERPEAGGRKAAGPEK